MDQKSYSCKCGQVFTIKNAFNAHQRFCIACHSETQVASQRQASRQGAIESKRIQQIKSKALAADCLTKWISEKHRCLKCGKVMTQKYGSGKFCSRACANSRQHSEETKSKIRQSVIKTFNSESFDFNAVNKKSVSGWYSNIFCASSYELVYLVYCLKNDIKVVRCPYKFKYEYEGSTHVYIPDFYLPDSNTIVELKGRNAFYIKEVVQLKQQSVGNNYNYKIIYDEEFNRYYLKWFMQYYNISSKAKANDFIKALLTNKPYVVPEDKSHAPHTKGYRWVNKDNKQTLIQLSKLQDYLVAGWQLGRLPIEPTEKMKQAWAKQVKPVKDVKEKSVYSFTVGKKQVSKGSEHIWVAKSELETYLADGWVLGRNRKQTSVHHSGGAHNTVRNTHKWINNGLENKFIPISLFESYLTQGWSKGRLKLL